MSRKEIFNLDGTNLLTILLATGALVLIGRIIFYDLPEQSRAPAATIITAGFTYAAQEKKAIEERERGKQIGWALMLNEGGNIILPSNWELDYINNARNLDSFDHNMKSASPPSDTATQPIQNWKMPTFFFDRKQPSQDFFIQEVHVGGDEEKTSVFAEMAEFLAQDTTQNQLQVLAKQACDYAMEKAGLEKLRCLNLIDRGTRFGFYSDVYLYLRVWLKNSIQFEMEMPDIGRSISDSSLYIDTFKFLRDERVEYFFVSEGGSIPIDQQVKKSIRHYLNFLISHLRKGTLTKWFNNTFYTPQKSYLEHHGLTRG